MSERINKARRRYTIDMLAAALLYMGSLFVCLLLSRQMQPGPMLTLLALIPIAPMAFAAFAFFRFYQRMDEMQQRISANAAALTLLVSILVALTLGILKRFGVLNVEDDMMWFAPFMIVCWGAVRFFIGGKDC